MHYQEAYGCAWLAAAENRVKCCDVIDPEAMGRLSRSSLFMQGLIDELPTAFCMHVESSATITG